MATQPQSQAGPQHTSPQTTLTIRNSDLPHALGLLRATPAADLSAIRTLRIVLTTASLLRWHGPVWPGAHDAFDDEDLDECDRLYPAPADPLPPPSEAFRALLRFVAGDRGEGRRFDLGRLELEVDASGAAWELFGDGAAAYATDDEVDRDWRFVYGFYVDVGRALAEVFGGRELRGLRVETSIWNGLGPWLAGRVTGREPVVAGGLPRFHDPGMLLLSGKREKVG